MPLVVELKLESLKFYSSFRMSVKFFAAFVEDLYERSLCAINDYDPRAIFGMEEKWDAPFQVMN